MEFVLIETFENLEPIKKDKIIRSSLTIFADKGYKDASTNKIVEAADISKGTLFYYFENKKGLYHYLIEYALDTVKVEYIDHIDSTTTDFIKRISTNSKIKYQYFQKFPEVQYFLSTVLYSDFDSLSKVHQQKMNKLIKISKEKLIDTPTIKEELFKVELDPKQASRIIQLAIEGYFSELIESFKQRSARETDFEKLWSDFDDFLELLHQTFYK